MRSANPRLLAVVTLAALSLPTLATFASPASASGRAAGTRSWFNSQIPKLLKRYHVAGASVAVIRDGTLSWSQGYGFADVGLRRGVTNDTVLQVASISKSVSAWGVMKLVEEGRVDLDAPVDRYLKRWHLPKSRFNDGVTVRRVLSHTAGLSLHGYPGNDPRRPLPTLVQSLSGDNSAGTPVRAVEEPGKRWRYSGGGYTVLQLLVEDVTGMPFATYMQRTILEPLKIDHSSYVWEKRLRRETARAYSTAPKAVPNYLYTEQAAAGLYTTAPDLARFVAVVSSTAANPVLQATTLNQILSAQPVSGGVIRLWGLSRMATTATGGYGFGVQIERLRDGVQLAEHTGANRGWAAAWIALPGKGAGLVVLTNSDTGALLYADVACGWITQVTRDSPRICGDLSVFRKSVFGGSIALDLILLAYIVMVAIGLSLRRRALNAPNAKGWIRLCAFLLIASAWVILWHTTTVSSKLGGFGFDLPPSVVVPPGFDWASFSLVAGLILTSLSALVPQRRQ